jgi:hypothetical protein
MCTTTMEVAKTRRVPFRQCKLSDFFAAEADTSFTPWIGHDEPISVRNFSQGFGRRASLDTTLAVRSCLRNTPSA